MELWIKRYCRSCKFCIDHECRESPPVGIGYYGLVLYPGVTKNNHKACSKYKPKEKQQ
jgi:hypothetical protein